MVVRGPLRDVEPHRDDIQEGEFAVLAAKVVAGMKAQLIGSPAASARRSRAARRSGRRHLSSPLRPAVARSPSMRNTSIRSPCAGLPRAVSEHMGGQPTGARVRLHAVHLPKPAFVRQYRRPHSSCVAGQSFETFKIFVGNDGRIF